MASNASAPRPLHTLQVVEAAATGVGRHVQALSAFLRGQGHRVTVAYATGRMDGAFRQFVSDHGADIRFEPLDLEWRISPRSDAANVTRLLRLIRREGPFDVVHGHSSKGGALARVAGRLSRVPVIYTPHSLIMASPELAPAKRRLYSGVELVLGRAATSRTIAVSDDERRLMLDLKLVPPARVVVVNNGLDGAVFERFSVPRRAREITPEAPLVFGAVIRFEGQKAPGDLVEAFSRLVRDLPDAPLRLVMAGEGDLLEATRRQVRSAGLEERVLLPGWRGDVYDVLAGCDVFVLSSLYEGFSYAVLEAMAARLPIVSTNVFGTGDTVARVRGNVVVPAGAPDALAEGMRSFAAAALDPEARATLSEVGNANHDFARARFTQDATMRRIVEVYQDVSKPAGRGVVAGR